MTWNDSPIHIVFYKDMPMDRLEKIVELHCDTHDKTVKDMCMSLVNLCILNDRPHSCCKGDGHNIRVDMLFD